MKIILVVNAGSSSMKVAGYNAETGAQNFKATINAVTNYKEAVEQALRDARGTVVGVGYRVVNGNGYNEPQVITEEVLENLTHAAKYAPLHNPPAIAGIRMLQRLYPNAKHIAVFDTAFFADMDEATKSYALPEVLRTKYLKFGYHGLSHQNVARTVKAESVVSVHLGSGCSVTAIENGKAVDTTLGYGTYDGVMMGTRSGSIDPAVVLDLARTMGVESAEKLLTQASGMAGVAGLPNDFRVIEAEMDAGNENAKLAYDMFIRSVVKQIGSMAVQLDSCVPTIAFTGGIAQNSARVRADIMAKVGKFFAAEVVVDCNEEGIILNAVKEVI